MTSVMLKKIIISINIMICYFCEIQSANKVMLFSKLNYIICCYASHTQNLWRKLSFAHLK